MEGKVNKKKIMGEEGERFARSFLERKGFVVKDVNWRWHHYELDIVAYDTNGDIVFVEVKTRSKGFLVFPEESINYSKIKRLSAAADAYIRRKGVTAPARFDVIILVGEPGSFEVEHIEDAFYPPLN